MKKIMVALLLLCGMLFAGTEVHETEDNNAWENADAFIFGDSLVGGFDETETTWHDSWTTVLDEFGVITITVNAGSGLSVAPCLWEGEIHKMLPCDWTEYGGEAYDQEYLFPGTYHLNMPGSADYGVPEGSRLTYSVLTTFQGSPSVKEVEPNNEQGSANLLVLGEEMTGVWSEEDFNTGGQTSPDYFEVYLETGVYRITAEFNPAVCFGAALQYPGGGRVFEVDDDVAPRMWHWRDGEGSKSADYEITEAGTYYIYAETEGCHFKTSEEDEFNYLLIPYEFTFVKVGDVGEEVSPPEPTLYDETPPEPELISEPVGQWLGLFEDELGAMSAEGEFVVFESGNDFVQFMMLNGEIVLDIPDSMLAGDREQKLMDLLGSDLYRNEYEGGYSLQETYTDAGEAAEIADRIFTEVYGLPADYPVTFYTEEGPGTMPSGDEVVSPPLPDSEFECQNDMDCEGIWEICVDGECRDILEEECEVECPEGEYASFPECECERVDGLAVCCGPAFALLAVLGFAGSRKR